MPWSVRCAVGAVTVAIVLACGGVPAPPPVARPAPAPIAEVLPTSEPTDSPAQVPDELVDAAAPEVRWFATVGGQCEWRQAKLTALDSPTGLATFGEPCGDFPTLAVGEGRALVRLGDKVWLVDTATREAKRLPSPASVTLAAIALDADLRPLAAANITDATLRDSDNEDEPVWLDYQGESYEVDRYEYQYAASVELCRGYAWTDGKWEATVTEVAYGHEGQSEPSCAAVIETDGGPETQLAGSATYERMLPDVGNPEALDAVFQKPEDMSWVYVGEKLAAPSYWLEGQFPKTPVLVLEDTGWRVLHAGKGWDVEVWDHGELVLICAESKAVLYRGAKHEVVWKGEAMTCPRPVDDES